MLCTLGPNRDLRFLFVKSQRNCHRGNEIIKQRKEGSGRLHLNANSNGQIKCFVEAMFKFEVLLCDRQTIKIFTKAIFDLGQKNKKQKQTLAALYAAWLFCTNSLLEFSTIISYSVKSCLWDCTSQ